MFDCWPPAEIACYRCEGRQLSQRVHHDKDSQTRYVCPHCKATTTANSEGLLEIVQMVAARQDRDSIWYSQRWFLTLNARYQDLELPITGAAGLNTAARGGSANSSDSLAVLAISLRQPSFAVPPIVSSSIQTTASDLLRLSVHVSGCAGFDGVGPCWQSLCLQHGCRKVLQAPRLLGLFGFSLPLIRR